MHTLRIVGVARFGVCRSTFAAYVLPLFRVGRSWMRSYNHTGNYTRHAPVQQALRSRRRKMCSSDHRRWGHGSESHRRLATRQYKPSARCAVAHRPWGGHLDVGHGIGTLGKNTYRNFFSIFMNIYFELFKKDHLEMIVNQRTKSCMSIERSSLSIAERRR